MNALFAAIPAGLIALFLVLRKRPVKPMLVSTDAQDIAALNRQQLSLVVAHSADSSPQHDETVVFVPPVTERDRLALRQRLTSSMNADPDVRLQAVHLADQWGSVSVLPILRRGLRDSDARVVEAAAAAMQRFRGATKRPAVQAARLPRNVARMR
ncbi:MAG: hypothetical protein CMN91_08710 [Synechococcus sp. ARS1019]|nr:hypothetical protein [Synechococcus sp. ARS1019]